MSQLPYKYINKREEKELMNSTGYSNHDFNVKGIPKLDLDFVKNEKELPKNRKYFLNGHKVRVFNGSKDYDQVKFPKLETEVRLSRRRTTDILITMNLLKKTG